MKISVALTSVPLGRLTVSRISLPALPCSSDMASKQTGKPPELDLSNESLADTAADQERIENLLVSFHRQSNM